MTWRHSSPDMRSGELLIQEPPCRPRVYRSEGTWTFYCPAHPEPRNPGAWDLVVRAARHHVALRPRSG